jgi:hypothetical protein
MLRRKRRRYSLDETMDYVLTKKIITEYLITAEPEVIYLGGIGAYIEKKREVLSNGIEIKYREFVKAQLGKRAVVILKIKIICILNKVLLCYHGNKAKKTSIF